MIPLLPQNHVIIPVGTTQIRVQTLQQYPLSGGSFLATFNNNPLASKQGEVPAVNSPLIINVNGQDSTKLENIGNVAFQYEFQ